MTFENLPLEAGTLYKQGCGEGYYDDAEAYAVEMLNGEKIEATTDTINVQPLEQVTITYNANGGTVEETSKTVREGEYVILPTASRDGYTFCGWSVENDNTPDYEAGSALKVTADTNLFAVWDNTPVSIPSVKSVKLSDISLNYKKGTTLKPEIVADSGAKYTVEYKSANPKIATVDENGNVLAKGKGTATITVTVTDEYGNTVEDTCTVTVKLTFIQKIIMYVLFGWLWGY